MYNNRIYTLINSDDKEKLIKILSHLYETVIEKFINQELKLSKCWIYTDEGTITYTVAKDNDKSINIRSCFKHDLNLIKKHLVKTGLKNIVDVKCLERPSTDHFVMGTLTISNKAEMKDIMLLMNLYKLKGII